MKTIMVPLKFESFRKVWHQSTKGMFLEMDEDSPESMFINVDSQVLLLPNNNDFHTYYRVLLLELTVPLQTTAPLRVKVYLLIKTYTS